MDIYTSFKLVPPVRDLESLNFVVVKKKLDG